MSLLEVVSVLQAIQSSQVTLIIRSTEVTFRHETYGYLNIIDEFTFNNIRKKPKVTPFEFYIKPYGHLQPVQTIGAFSATCKYNGVKKRQKFVITKGNYGNLLSYQASVDLGVVILVEKKKSRRRKLSEEMFLEEFKIAASRPNRIVRSERDEEKLLCKKNISLSFMVKSKSSENDMTVEEEKNRLTPFEKRLLRSEYPLKVDNQTKKITVNSESGLWVNKDEALNWDGLLPIESYQINESKDTEVINKKNNQFIEYTQEMTVRYLRPETPVNEIIITQEADHAIQSAPPIIIRHFEKNRPKKSEPLVFREAPPEPPRSTSPKVVKIRGKRLPPPPRKVIIERLPPVPKKPQNLIVERWLSYNKAKRRVIFKNETECEAEVFPPRNIVIQWEAPECRIVTRVVNLGIIEADPKEYLNKYKTKD